MSTKMVIELQKMASEGKVKASEVLKKAYLVAVKLQLVEAKSWLRMEMHGYSQEDCGIPEYRRVKGAIGSQYTSDTRGSIILRESIDKIEQHTIFAGAILTLSNSDIEHNKNEGKRIVANTIDIDSNDFRLVLTGFVNEILVWAAELESEGVVIENMVATKDEIEKSKSVMASVYNMNIQNNYAENNQQNNHFSAIEVINIKDIIEHLENNTDKLEVAEDAKTEIKKETTVIKEETKKDKPNRQAIKAALFNIAGLVGNVSCSIVASGIVEKLHLFK